LPFEARLVDFGNILMHIFKRVSLNDSNRGGQSASLHHFLRYLLPRWLFLQTLISPKLHQLVLKCLDLDVQTFNIVRSHVVH
jgi:hypothetical protein